MTCCLSNQHINLFWKTGVIFLVFFEINESLLFFHIFAFRISGLNCAEAYRPFEVRFRLLDDYSGRPLPSKQAPKMDIWCTGLIIYQLLCLMKHVKDESDKSADFEFLIDSCFNPDYKNVGREMRKSNFDNIFWCFLPESEHAQKHNFHFQKRIRRMKYMSC